MKKRVRFLCTVLLLSVCVSLSASATSETTLPLEVCTLQVDERYKDTPYGDLTVAESACGPATICNCVYYLTGNAPTLIEVCDWAYGAKLYNAPGVPGCYRSVFQRSAGNFGGMYGYSATEFRYGNIKTPELVEHLKNGGTAALHVPGHFMACVGYDAERQAFLVIDPLPGDYGKYDRRRKGITHAGGDFLTAETLSTGYTLVDGYALFTRTLSEREKEAFASAVLAGVIAP